MSDTATRNIATVHAIYRAFGNGDIPAIIDTLAEDVAWESWGANHAQAARVPWLESRSGREGALGFFQVTGSEFDIKEFQVLDVGGSGNQVFAEFIMDATIRSTGKHFRDEEIHLWTFNDAGKVSRLRHYVDTAKHIDAATK